MSTTLKERIEVLTRLNKIGIGYDDAQALRRISMTLHRWYELECGTEHGAIERDEKTDIPYYYRYSHSYLDPHDPRARYRVPDREKGAKLRLAKIMSKYSDMQAYIQTDPRGCALYILSAEVLEQYKDMPVDSIYNNGIAVY